MKVYFLYIFLFTAISILGQPAKQAPNLPYIDFKPLTFGFLIGINVMNYHIIHNKTENLALGTERRYADVINLNPGLSLGMVTNFRINKRLYFRMLPSITFGQRDLLFVDDNNDVDKFPLEIKSTYIESPLLIRFYGYRMLNARPYLIGGINPRYDLAKSVKDGLRIRPFDVYWEIGVGLISYLGSFRLSTEIKTSVGLMNILDPQGVGGSEDIYYTGVLDKMFSRIFILTIYFE